MNAKLVMPTEAFCCAEERPDESQKKEPSGSNAAATAARASWSPSSTRRPFELEGQSAVCGALRSERSLRQAGKRACDDGHVSPQVGLPLDAVVTAPIEGLAARISAEADGYRSRFDDDRPAHQEVDVHCLEQERAVHPEAIPVAFKREELS